MSNRAIQVVAAQALHLSAIAAALNRARSVCICGGSGRVRTFRGAKRSVACPYCTSSNLGETS